MNWLRLSIKPVFARLSGILNGIISLMNLSIAPTRNRIDFAQQEEALAQIFALQSQLAERDAELKRRELKIQQLTLELAHHKRIRFGCKSEALSPEQRDLFVESCDEDGAAIAAELEQQQKAKQVVELKDGSTVYVFDGGKMAMESKYGRSRAHGSGHGDGNQGRPEDHHGR